MLSVRVRFGTHTRYGDRRGAAGTGERMSTATALIPLTGEPCRLAATGTFPLPGLGRYTIGREELGALTPDIIATGERIGSLSVDIETAGKTGMLRYTIKAVIIGTEDESWVFDPRDPYQFELLRRILNGEQIFRLVFHNSVFDVPPLYLTGILDMGSIDRVLDTLLYARLAEPDEKTRKSLGDAANRYLGVALSDPLPEILKATGLSKSAWYLTKDMSTPAWRIMAATDAILTARILRPVQDAAFARLTSGHPFPKYGVTGTEANDLVQRAQIINRQKLKRACKGYLVDPEYLDDYRAAKERELREAEKELDALGIRPGNSGDLTSWLETNGHLPAKYPRTTKTKKPSGSKDHLKRLTHPIAATFIRHKEETHILRDYLDKTLDAADRHGRIHPVTNLLAAATGRSSISGDAPLHQFSGPARGILLADNWQDAKRTRLHDVVNAKGDALPCTCADPRGMVSIDWSQIEPVIVANVAGDLQAIEYYEAGNKFYNALVEFGGIPYKAAKTTLLAQLYGEGITKLAADLQISVEEAESIRDMIWTVLPGTQKLVDKAWKGGKLQKIAEKYKLVFTLSGRIVPIPSGYWPCWGGHEDQDEIDACTKCNGKGLTYSVAAHKGVNYFVQGSAYDLLAESNVRIIEAGLGDAVYFDMHDEIVCDQEAAHDIRRIMETPPERLCMLANRTPKLRTDMAHLGERWAAA